VTIRNGVMRLRECTSAITTYFCFVMEYEALADERRAGLLDLWINPDARSVSEWPGLLETATPSDYLFVSDRAPVCRPRRCWPAASPERGPARI
jgi:hypothetical protein